MLESWLQVTRRMCTTYAFLRLCFWCITESKGGPRSCRWGLWLRPRLTAR